MHTPVCVHVSAAGEGGGTPLASPGNLNHGAGGLNCRPGTSLGAEPLKCDVRDGWASNGTNHVLFAQENKCELQELDPQKKRLSLLSFDLSTSRSSVERSTD